MNVLNTTELYVSVVKMVHFCVMCISLGQGVIDLDENHFHGMVKMAPGVREKWRGGERRFT